MRKKTRKILTGIGITVVVLGVIYAVATAISSAKLRKAYAALEKEGRPMKQSDIIPPEVPDEDNAALLYESAFLLLKAQPAPDKNLLEYLSGLCDKFLNESIETEELDELQKLIEQDTVTQALSIIEDGTRRHSCRFDYDYNAGFNMLMPNLSNMRNTIRIIGVKSCLLAEAGSSDAAWQLAQTQLKLADAMRNEPILISFLVRLASINIACQTIHRICKVAPPNAEQYNIIEKLLLDNEDRTQIILSMDGERLLGGEWAFSILRNGSAKDLSVITNSESGLVKMVMSLYSAFKPLSLSDKAAYMRIMAEYTRFVQQPYSPNDTSTIDRKVKQMQGHLHIITSILVPSIGRVKQRYWETVAQMRITRAGLALLQERKTQDVFPQTLEMLQIENLDDPFSTEALRYKPQGRGFIIYSVGPNHKDNGGTKKQKKQKDEWDIVWSYNGES